MQIHKRKKKKWCIKLHVKDHSKEFSADCPEHQSEKKRNGAGATAMKKRTRTASERRYIGSHSRSLVAASLKL